MPRLRRLIIITILTIVSVFFILFISIWINFLKTPIVNSDEGVRYTVQNGATLRSVIHELYLLDVIKDPTLFHWLARIQHAPSKLKAGEYFFANQTTPNQLLTQIMLGQGMVYHQFTIIAGWSFRHLRSVLNKNPYLQHTSAKLSKTEIMRQLGSAEINPEGMFFPDTYFFVRNTSDIVILRQAYDRMKKKLHQAWQNRESNLPYKTPIEALTVASLIEKETSQNFERAMISGVILNRLNKNMRLQIDPTVIYAAGAHFDGTIHRADLTRKSPYNTYQHKGLPPTPIGIASLASIEAALHPVHHEYIYFVAKNFNMEGPHRFSKTLKEHNQAIKRAKKKKSHIEFFNNTLIRHYFEWQVLLGIYQ